MNRIVSPIVFGRKHRVQQCMKCRNCDNFLECKHYEKTDTECEYYEFPINNSKWSFVRLFSFKGRIGRTEMWLTSLGCFISAILVNIYFIENTTSTSLIYLVNGILLWILCAQYVKRLHDLDRPGTDIFLLVLGLLIPFLHDSECFYSKGVDEVNKYGTSPNKSFESQVYKPDDNHN